ncbi:MAG TPA: glycosyltransferase [Jatrophihabitans sp.]|nr:glycosyltransferase [Jatrophihabitans sp.]
MSSADPNRPVLIGIPVYGRLELLQRAVRAVDRHTPVEIELVLIDDCGPDRLTESMLAEWLTSARAWRLIRHQTNAGFVSNANEFFELAGDSDVIVLNSDVEVLPGWFEGLRAAITSKPRAASASAMADNCPLLEVPELARPGAQASLAAVRVAVPVAAKIPVAVGHCTWFHRRALAEVGSFDRAFDPGYGEEVDWSMRASKTGWLHLAALHSFVLHEGGASFGWRRGWLRRWHELRLLRRYPLRWCWLRLVARNHHTAFGRARRRICKILRAA